LYLLPPDNFNHRHALPNKFFEFVQACLVVAIGPSPEMAALARKHGCGIVAASFEPQALADALSALDGDRVRALKEASHRAAQSLCFEQDGRVIEAEVERLT
jgi:alkanesulfonate monooxygenase SsuD/methylene tetrahydromethanopterin reductase-like flavin-dependent oxidoreductase (luciferase family)